jgi:hypothetical protein
MFCAFSRISTSDCGMAAGASELSTVTSWVVLGLGVAVLEGATDEKIEDGMSEAVEVKRTVEELL